MEINPDKNDLFIKRKINEMDTVFPKELGDQDMLWDEISERLHPVKKSRRWKSLAIAASVSLLILAGVLLVLRQPKEEVITYKTETVYETKVEQNLENSKQEENNALEYVNEQCKLEKPACQSEEFIELKQQLNDVDQTLYEIDKQQKIFGSDPVLVKAQIAAENQKAYLLKELVQILRS